MTEKPKTKVIEQRSCRFSPTGFTFAHMRRHDQPRNVEALDRQVPSRRELRQESLISCSAGENAALFGIVDDANEATARLDDVEKIIMPLGLNDILIVNGEVCLSCKIGYDRRADRARSF